MEGHPLQADAAAGGAGRRYLNTSQAADYLGMSPTTLNRMRVTGEGPPYSKVGRRVIYDISELDAWVARRKRHFTGETVETDDTIET